MRIVLALMMLAFTLATPAVAQSSEQPWQDAVTGQIEAFRSGDGAAALEFAAASFKAQFDDPDVFYAAIKASGYGPIIDSRSHTFGEFQQVNADTVVQVVRFVGPERDLYEALYQMANEPDEGWRVQGVVLRKEAGVAI